MAREHQCQGPPVKGRGIWFWGQSGCHRPFHAALWERLARNGKPMIQIPSFPEKLEIFCFTFESAQAPSNWLLGGGRMPSVPPRLRPGSLGTKRKSSAKCCGGDHGALLRRGAGYTHGSAGWHSPRCCRCVFRALCPYPGSAVFSGWSKIQKL